MNETQALERLREYFPQGSTVYTSVESLGRQNMSANVRIYAETETGYDDVTELYATAMGHKTTARGRYHLGGLGTDRYFLIAYNLSCKLYGLKHDQRANTGPYALNGKRYYLQTLK